MQYDFNNNWIGNASLLHSRILAHCSWREREKNRKENIKWGIFDCVRDLFIEVYARRMHVTRLDGLTYIFMCERYIWTRCVCGLTPTNEEEQIEMLGFRCNDGDGISRWRGGEGATERIATARINYMYFFFEFIFIIVNSRVKREFGSFVRLTWFETM